MKVLVTGASGFLGRRVLEALAGTEFEVHATGRGAAAGPATAWHTADLLNGRQREQLVADVAPSHLIHLAWTTEHGDFWEAPENVDWSAATIDLVERFALHGGTRALLAGSCAEYDWSDPGLAATGCHEGTTPLHPTTRYGRAKLATFRETAQLGERHGVAVVWARFFFLFGIDEAATRLVPTLVRAALRGEPAGLRHPDRVLDFMSTRDAAQACLGILRSDVTGPINVASGRGVRLDCLAGMIGTIAKAEAGSEPAPEAGASKSALRLVADITRLSTEVDYDPKHDLEASLTPVVEWWRNHANRQDARLN